MAAVPVTAEIARRASALAWHELPDDLVERTKQCLLDWFAVTIAGAQEELTDILIREAIEDGAAGPATLVGRSEKVLPSTAALINGAASHALDYDDVNFAMGGHPTVTVVPVLLAAGLMCSLLLVTFDLDRPTRGLIEVPATPLTDLRQSMNLPPAATAPARR